MRSPLIQVYTLLLAAVLLGGCVALDSDDAVPALPIPSGVDGPVIRATETYSTVMDAIVEGRVFIEDGCVYVSGLESSIGRRLVIWPKGAQWLGSPEEGVLVYPGLVLHDSDAFTAGGGSVSFGGLRDFTDQAGYDKAIECRANTNSSSAVVVPQVGIKLREE